MFVGASIGISTYPRDGNSVDQLLRNADAAMYSAKDKGRNNYQFYTEELTASAYERVTLESSLRRAIDRDELEVFYQPLVSLPEKTVIGAEALVRWNHPDLGMLEPAKFLPVSEDSSLIIPIGEQVLRAACSQMAQWKSSDKNIDYIAVNISGKQVRLDTLPSLVESILQETGCKPEWLELEISENFIMSETEYALNNLDQLSSMGVRLAIDDFGTGYSSLSYLKRLPVDKLKIDCSFVRDLDHDPNDDAIAEAIIALGQSLQLETLAEGVEKIEQEKFLAELGCHQVQGFLYGHPVQPSEFDPLISRNSIKTGAR